MEIHDGFIVGIFNYCDRWCEACPFTSHCRVFADHAMIEASLDPTLAAVVEAPPLPQDVPPPPPRWLEELIDEMNRPPTDAGCAAVVLPSVRPEHQSIGARSQAYCLAILHWMRGREDVRHARPDDPLAIISWFASLNAAKIHRALIGLAADDGERDYPPDYEGSAKVAIIGVERSLAAWRQLVASGVMSGEHAEPFLTELSWLLKRLDEVFPMARAFVRPAFDEPDEVARLTRR